MNLEQLIQHKCFYYIFKNKDKFFYDSNFLNKILMINRIRATEQYRACSGLFQSLVEAKIPFAVYKGAPLAIAIYGDTGYRSSGDIDILIHRSNLRNFDKIINSFGFKQGKLIDNKIIEAERDEKIFHLANTHQTVPYIKFVASKLVPFVNVDVNMNITWGECIETIDMNSFLDKTEYMDMFRELSIPVLDTEKHFISVCLHNYKDINSPYLLYSRNGFPLSCLADIYYMRQNGKINIKRLYNLASKYSVEKYIYYCLYHSKRFFGDLEKDELMTLLSPKVDNGDLWKYGLEERFEWNCDWIELLLNNQISEFIKDKMPATDFNRMMLNAQYMNT